METVYEGVRLHDVLKNAGVPLGSELRGKALTSYVLAEAQDGYQVVFSLGELDPSFIDNEILLADTANGKPLFGAQGRFRLVVPKDKPGSRSVRMLTRLEVVQVRK
jgi:DMSO/TMAO reductase YedYZ molybdopterin-dependent catalytic subunit